MTNQVFFMLALTLVFVSMLTPFVRKAYQRTCYPVFRPPHTEILINSFLLITVALVFSFLYAATSGGIVLLVRGPIDSSKPLLAGAVSGAFVYGAARLWALFYSHSFARSLYLTCILTISVALSIGMISPGTITTITDDVLKRGNDNLTLLPICFLLSIVAALLPEIIVRVFDRLGLASVPFSLVREQLESFGSYPLLRGKERIVKAIEEQLYSAVIGLDPGQFLDVKWLTADGWQDVRREIERWMKEGDSRGSKVNVEVLCHSTETAKENLRNFSGATVRYFRTSGNTRILLIGDRVGFVGIQMGYERHTHFPDYVMIVSDPLQIGVLKTIFKRCWEASA